MLKKIIRKIALYICLPILLIFLISTFYVAHYYTRADTEPKDCAVVFGAAVWKDDQPSHALYDRTVTAIELYNENLVTCLVFSGGPSRYGAREVDVMRNIASEYNVPDVVIINDHNGLDTQATIQNLDPTKSYIFVSNDFHLARIALLAHQYSIKDFSLHRATYYRGRYFKEPQFFLHEVIGTIYYFFHLDHII